MTDNNWRRLLLALAASLALVACLWSPSLSHSETQAQDEFNLPESLSTVSCSKAGLAEIARLYPGMESLDSTFLKLVDSWAPTLVKFKHLTRLCLAVNPIGDASIPYLLQRKTLNARDVHGTYISLHGAGRLKKGCPHCLISYSPNYG